MSPDLAGLFSQTARLTEAAYDPADIKPGWIALVIVLLLCAATTLLWLNMRKQLRKVTFEEQDIPRRRRPEPPPE